MSLIGYGTAIDGRRQDRADAETGAPGCNAPGCGGLITSNLPFDEWTETFGSERLTGALLDRLTHHVHILEMNGGSFRLNHSRARKMAPAG